MESPVYISNHAIPTQKQKDVHEEKRKNLDDPISTKSVVKLVMGKNLTVTQTAFQLILMQFISKLLHTHLIFDAM